MLFFEDDSFLGRIYWERKHTQYHFRTHSNPCLSNKQCANVRFHHYLLFGWCLSVLCCYSYLSVYCVYFCEHITVDTSHQSDFFLFWRQHLSLWIAVISRNVCYMNHLHICLCIWYMYINVRVCVGLWMGSSITDKAIMYVCVCNMS